MPKQISFKADPELAERIESGAEFEEIPVADFVRKLFRYAIAEYEREGSLHALRERAEAESETGVTLISTRWRQGDDFRRPGFRRAAGSPAERARAEDRRKASDERIRLAV